MSEGPRILLFTGDGKGKTTAALGMALRAVGHGLRVFIVQFIKNDPRTGEKRALQLLPHVEFHQVGLGFVPTGADDRQALAPHQKAAEDGLKRVGERLRNGACDLVILDEICTACALGLVSETEVLELLSNSPPGLTWVLTGRDAPESFAAMADTVTVMVCQKHGFDTKMRAKRGVEF
ncbi:MAG: cob(I)yrinic acid a,c-diamide adenosyltransferase [Syntrophales bacterium]|jgi:cob(I)alamin adenosyltransferase|nr:cob(I)yrinic acid a,c-diamide adenosyltransferase [Syntrophales bacterium]